MSNWSEQQFTRKGAELRAKVEAGKCKLALTKMKIGNGSVAVGEIEHLTDLKSPQLVFGISSCTVSEEDSTVCKTVGIASSSNVENSFSVSEMGLYATDPDIGEILYLVCIDSAPDTMPNKRVASPVTLTYQFDIVTSNTANVTAMITPTGLATAKMVNEHRTAAELDHPEKSVKRKHLADNVYTLPAPEATNAARFVGGDHKVRDVTPGSIGAYTKGEVDSRVDAKINKSGDTMTGTLHFSHNGSHIVGKINGSDYYRITGINAGSNNGYLELAVADDIAEGIVVRQYDNIGGYHYGDFSKPAREAWLLNSDGNTSFPQAVTASKFYVNDWYRCNGTGGIYWEKYGGGWYMSDNDWIRTNGNKNIYTSGKIKADSGFEGALHGRADSAGNSDTLGGQSLQWIINQINAAKTGIVAGNLAQNGWVKFANGLIVQWGAIRNYEYNMFPVAYTQWVHVFLVASMSTMTPEANSSTYGATLVGDPTLTKFFPLVGNTEYERGITLKTGVGRWMSIGV